MAGARAPEVNDRAEPAVLGEQAGFKEVAVEPDGRAAPCRCPEGCFRLDRKSCPLRKLRGEQPGHESYVNVRLVGAHLASAHALSRCPSQRSGFACLLN
jgi:hypothetical protein